MSMINSKKVKSSYRDGAHQNFMGGDSYNLTNPLTSLRIAAASSFFGEPKYYQGDKTTGKAKQSKKVSHSSGTIYSHLESLLGSITPSSWVDLTSAQIMEKAIDDALDHDAEGALSVAVALRNEDHIRTTPQVILVRAANHQAVKGTELIGKFAPQIVKRADEPAVGMAYQLAVYGKPIPNSLKRAWGKLLSGYNGYSLAKYRMDGRQVRTADVVSLTHAGNGTGSRQTLSDNKTHIVRGGEPGPIDLLMGDTKGASTLRNTDTWEAVRSAGGTWDEAFAKMGHMALLRNVRNLTGADVDNNAIAAKLKLGASTGQQLPFRYWTAYRENASVSPLILDALEECLKISMDNLPTFKGRVMSLCDNSGSAQGATTSSLGSVKVSEIANLTAALTAQNSEEGYVGVFGDKLEVRSVRKSESLFSVAKDLNKLGNSVGQATENGVWIFWRDAIKKKQHWDSVFIYSDMQAGHGGLYGVNPKEFKDHIWPEHSGSHYIDVASLINKYRREVNPKVMVYLVQVAGYKDTIMPEFFDRTFILGGWSEAILSFAAKMTELYDQKETGRYVRNMGQGDVADTEP
jgi:hypothetical protein